MNRKLIAAIVVLVAGVLGLHFWAGWEKARFDASLPQPPAVEKQQVIDDTADDTAGDTAEDTSGHWHGDEWHAESDERSLGLINPDVDLNQFLTENALFCQIFYFNFSN